MRPESLYFLFSPVTRIKGVGPQMGKTLERLLPNATQLSGSNTPIVRDLLFHLPIGIVDRRFSCGLHEAPDGAIGTFVVTVDQHIEPPPNRYSKKPYRVICSNDTGDITLVFFNVHGDYLTKTLPVGQKRVISGRVERFDGMLQMSHPDIIARVDQLAEVRKPEAVYPLTAELSNKRLTKIIQDTLEKLPDLPEWISADTMAKQGWKSWKTSLQLVHKPESSDDLLANHPARMRLAYDEILSHQLHLGRLRLSMQAQPGEVITGQGTLAAEVIARLPFTLTDGQQRVIEEIKKDMASGKRMTRLLQGDVGSGKTIVALLSMLGAVEQGMQVALMVPTELIAQQHYENIRKLLATSNLQLATILLTGSIKGKAREKILTDIASGDAKIVIGTHALFQEHVHFAKLACVVIDEQHRFGVAQRMALTSKGTYPHILHMTATPIPRSLTMMLYGDMDASILTEKPAERQPITTRVIPLSRYKEVVDRMQAALDRGEKSYWICPLIEGDASEDDDVAAATLRHREFTTRFGPVVGLVHGRMKAAERDEQMRKFATGDYKMLVATTVVEVGVDVRDATIMVIEHAERFGLSQLHQLRGRVGRGDKPSSCALLYSEPDDRLQMTDDKNSHSSSSLSVIRHPSSETRLRVLRDTEDGFKIAEADLAIRGGGELLGARQSGLPRFVFLDFIQHQPLVLQAREEVAQFLAADPALESERGKSLGLLLEIFSRAE